MCLNVGSIAAMLDRVRSYLINEFPVFMLFVSNRSTRNQRADGLPLPACHPSCRLTAKMAFIIGADPISGLQTRCRKIRWVVDEGFDTSSTCQNYGPSGVIRSNPHSICSADVWGHHGFYTAVMQSSILWPSTNF